MSESSRRLDTTESENYSGHLSPQAQQTVQSYSVVQSGDDISSVSSNDTLKPAYLRTASQYCAICASSLLTLTYGISIGFTTMIIGEIQSNRTDITVTEDQLTWISSMNYFAIPLGAIISGWISTLFGRRNVLAFATIPYICSWLIFRIYGTNVGVILLAFFVSGITGGLIESPLQIYVTEISEPRLRGSISASVSSTIMFGIFSQTLLGAFFPWRTLVLINLIFPMTALVALFLVPESPYWLASKNRLNDARKSLAWLRGWAEPENIDSEFDAILQSVRTDESESSVTKISVIKRCFRRSVYLPFLLISFTFFVSCFNGSVSILSFALSNFEDLKSPINKETATILLAVLQIVGTLLLVVLVPCFGKRKMTFVSLTVSGLSILYVAVYTLLVDRRIISEDITWQHWIVMLAILNFFFFTHVGIKSIPWILTGELFPTDVRGEAAGLVGATCNIYAAIASKIYISMKNVFTRSGTFFIFSLVNFIGLVVLFIFLPETEGKTLIEIERYFEEKGENISVVENFKRCFSRRKKTSNTSEYQTVATVEHS